MRNVTFILIVLLSLNYGLKAQIVNGGFEDWRTNRVYEEPSGIWGAFNTSAFQPVTKSTDHFPYGVGKYSVRIENKATLTPDGHAIGYGILMSNPLFGAGVTPKPNFPIVGHPNSLYGYYKFSPLNGDTMNIGVVLYKNHKQVAFGLYSEKNTVSNWTSFKLSIPNYTDADSACIFFSCSIAGNPRGNSVMYIDNVSFDALITSTDTNFGFENWSTNGNYEVPTGIWGTLNKYSSNLTYHPVKKSTDHYPENVGQYSVLIENLSGIPQGPGVGDPVGYGCIMSDPLYDKGYYPRPNFSIAGHPNSFRGYYKYTPLNGDTMMIGALLYKNGKEVSTAIISKSDQILNWTSFKIQFTNYVAADSACIFLTAFNPDFNPRGNSKLYVDNISFSDSLISTSVEQKTINNSVSFFPCPASNVLYIGDETLKDEIYTFKIYNNIGALLSTFKYTKGQRIDISQLNNGIYLVELSSINSTKTGKIMINK